MLTWKEIIQHFGKSLNDELFQEFLNSNFSDLTEYNILKSDYIISEIIKIEIGFTNHTAVFDDDTEEIFEQGNPIFSHVIIYPGASINLHDLPYNLNFEDSRDLILSKSGNPVKSRTGTLPILNTDFLVDNYLIENIIFSIDYNVESQIPNHIQFRDPAISTGGL